MPAMMACDDDLVVFPLVNAGGTTGGLWSPILPELTGRDGDMLQVVG
jgi:hypothetical protein